MFRHANTRRRHGPRMHESTAKETGVGILKMRCSESGDLGTEHEGKDSCRVRPSTGRADLEVDEDREDPEPRRKCRRRRPGRATGEH